MTPHVQMAFVVGVPQLLVGICGVRGKSTGVIAAEPAAGLGVSLLGLTANALAFLALGRPPETGCCSLLPGAIVLLAVELGCDGRAQFAPAFLELRQAVAFQLLGDVGEIDT
jgi:hypothetical protein